LISPRASGPTSRPGEIAIRCWASPVCFSSWGQVHHPRLPMAIKKSSGKVKTPFRNCCPYGIVSFADPIILPMRPKFNSPTVPQTRLGDCLAASRKRPRGRARRAAFCVAMLACIPFAWTGCVGVGGGGGDVVYGGGAWFGDGAWVDGGGRGSYAGRDNHAYIHPSGGGHADSRPSGGGGHAEAHSSGGGGHDHR
jgi:hypothetical protein